MRGTLVDATAAQGTLHRDLLGRNGWKSSLRIKGTTSAEGLERRHLRRLILHPPKGCYADPCKTTYHPLEHDVWRVA